MFSNTIALLQFGLTPMIVAQEVVTPEEASLIFSGPKFFVALLSGVVMAFAFQLLLTNFSVAVGISSLGNNSFVDLISNRTNFSKEDINRIADQLEGAWKQVINQQNPTDQVINFLSEASPKDLNSEKLGERLQELVTVGGSNGGGNGVLQPAIRYGLGAAVPAVLGKVKFSDLDVEKITAQLPKLKEKVQDLDVEKITSQLKDQAAEQIAKKSPTQPENAIKKDVEDYIRDSFSWHFNRITIKDEFKEVIYDPNADPSTVRRQLEELNSEYFNNLLTQRGDVSEARVKEIVGQLESVRSEVLETLPQAEPQEESQDLRSRIENYLRSTGKEELNPEGIQQDFAKLLEDPEAGVEDLSDRFQEFDRDTLVQLLQQREDLSEEEANNIVGQLESTRDNVLNRAKDLQEQAKAKADELRQKVEDYLRNTNKEELNPEAIKRDFGVLLSDPQAGVSLLRDRLSQFDRDTLLKLLSQRQDLSEEQVNRTIDSVQEGIDRIVKTPQRLANRATQKVSDFQANLELTFHGMLKRSF